MTPENVRTVLQSTENLNQTYLGSRESVLGIEEHIGINDTDRLMHVLCTGPTGSGKTQLMIHTALQDAYKGNGFAFINPKGDAIHQLIAKLPEERHDDIIYINPGSRHATALNVLEPQGTADMTPQQKDHHCEIIVSDVLDLFRRQSDGDLGARWGRLLETLLRALVSQNIHRDERNTLLDVYECVTDDAALTDLIDRTADQVTREELVSIKQDMSSYDLGPIRYRLNDFLRPTIRNMINVAESSVDFRQAVNENKIILVDIQKGEIGATVSEIIGSIILTKLWAAAQSRITEARAARNPFHVYIDEIQNFAGEGSSIAEILSESREYKLGCWLATQYISNIRSSQMTDALTNNCRTKIVFDPKGDDDLPQIARMLPGMSKDDLARLGQYQAAVQTPGENGAGDAVVMSTYPPYTADDSHVEQVKRAQSFPVKPEETSVTAPSLGSGGHAGQEHHTKLLQAAHSHFTDDGYTVNLLYQDGDSKPDGHLLKDDEITHLEAEASTLSKPAKVLRNLHRAAQHDRACVFVVEQGDGRKLHNIVSDPVNRQGSSHEDSDGTYDYYSDEDGAFTAVDQVQDADYEIYEVWDDSLVAFDEMAGEDVECPEVAAGHAAEAELQSFCMFRESDGFCTKLGQPCTLTSDD